MTLLGWLIMSISIGVVLALNVFCLYRVLTLPPVEIEHLDTAPCTSIRMTRRINAGCRRLGWRATPRATIPWESAPNRSRGKATA